MSVRKASLYYRGNDRGTLRRLERALKLALKMDARRRIRVLSRGMPDEPVFNTNASLVEAETRLTRITELLAMRR